MFDRNQPAAMRRSGDEFLRRMTTGEMPGRSLPTMNRPSPAPMPPAGNCPGTCPDQGGGRNCIGQLTGNPAMPSLAMVYSPKQEWRCLMSPQTALDEGSLFGELIKPFEGRSIYRQGR